MSDIEPTIEELPERVIVGYRRVLTGRSCVFCATAATKIYKRGDLMPLHAHCDCSVAPVFVGDDPAFDLNREVLNNLKARGRKYWEQRGFVDDKGRPIDPTDLPDAKTSTNREVGEVFDNELVQAVDLDISDASNVVDNASSDFLEEAQQRLSEKVSARAVDDRLDELLEQNPMSNVDAMRSAIEGAFKRDVDLSDLSDLDDDVAEVIVNRLEELDDQFPGVLDGFHLKSITVDDVEWVPPSTPDGDGLFRYADPARRDDALALGEAYRDEASIGLSRHAVADIDGVPDELRATPLAPYGGWNGWLVDRSGTRVEGILDHEFGHFVFNRANRWAQTISPSRGLHPDLLRRVDDAIAAEMKRTGVYDRDGVISAAISQYATTNVDELMAEAFSQFVGSPEPSDLARALVAIMMEQP